MKTAIAIILVAVCMASARPITGNIQLAWDYPTNELSTNLTFIIYESTNLNSPAWNFATNVVGTNTTANLIVVPGQHYFVATASNFWGESIASNTASTPPTPKSNSFLRIFKLP